MCSPAARRTRQTRSCCSHMSNLGVHQPSAPRDATQRSGYSHINWRYQSVFSTYFGLKTSESTIAIGAVTQ